MDKIMQGFVQIYTGDGKGKTTAAIGLAVRAAGAGIQVYLAQFLKEGDYSECIALKRFSDLITIEQFGLGRFIKGKPSDQEIAAAQKGLEKVKGIMAGGEHKLVILDEANVAVMMGLLTVRDLLDFIAIKPEDTELVLTGRGAPDEVMEVADLVTEMKAIKHYYTKGVQARVGIEK